VSTSDRPGAGSPPPSWRRRERPLRLERRLEFADYAATQAFLEEAAALSELTGIYPDLGFGRTYINLTLFADEASGELTPAIADFARGLEDLVPVAGGREEDRR